MVHNLASRASRVNVKTRLARFTSRWRCDLLVVGVVLLMSITSVLTGLVSAVETDSTFPRGAQLTLIIRGAPPGVTPETLTEEFRELRPQFVESSLHGEIIHAPLETESGSELTWQLPLGRSTTLSAGTYPDSATGVMTLQGDIAEMAQVVRSLNEQGYETIATIRTTATDLPPWMAPPLGPITFLAFLCAVGSTTLLHLNRRVAAAAIDQTLGRRRLAARGRDGLALVCWALATTMVVGAVAIASVGFFSPSALRATGFVPLLIATLLLQWGGIVSAIAAAVVVSEVTAAPLLERLHSVASQQAIIAASAAALALFTGTALVITPVMVNVVDQLRSSARVGEQWENVPDVTSVSLFALAEPELQASAPSVRQLVLESSLAGTAVLNDPDDECEMAAAGLGGDCVLHLNDTFFSLSGQKPEQFGLPEVAQSELIVAIPRSRAMDSDQITHTAQEWAGFESRADCEVTGDGCTDIPAPPTVRVVTYEDGFTLESFTANSSLHGGPAEYSNPVLYYYSLSSPWLSTVNTIGAISGGGISFMQSAEVVREQWGSAGLRDLVADVTSSRESALVAAQRLRNEALVNGTRVLIALAVSVVSVVLLAAAECRRQHDRLLAAFVLGRRWLSRHWRFLSLAGASLATGLGMAVTLRGTDRGSDWVLWAICLGVLMTLAAFTVSWFDRRICGDSAKER